jgi:uncharacterized membrane protein YdjX (TVP38/TMEM64 family)
MNKSKLCFAIAVVSCLLLFFALDLDAYFTLESFNAQRDAIHAYCTAHPGRSAVFFVAIYLALAALSLPGILLMTVVAGDLFGLVFGSALVSSASTLAATLPFLAARYLWRDAVRQRFGRHLATIDAGIEKNGAYYLFSLRFLPISPFFVINLVMGLTSISTATYMLVSQLGMLLGTIVLVNAGTHIGRITSLTDLLSGEVIASLVLLAVFPLCVKRLVDFVRARMALGTSGHSP